MLCDFWLKFAEELKNEEIHIPFISFQGRDKKESAAEWLNEYNFILKNIYIFLIK